jgi:type IV pilus assembly protein PilB
MEQVNGPLYDPETIVSTAHGIITEAINLGATEIHIDPETEQATLSFRKGEALHQDRTVPGALYETLVNRYKLMARIKRTWERRVPQEGVVKVHYQGQDYDLCLNTTPTPKGEKIVMRLIQPNS